MVRRRHTHQQIGLILLVALVIGGSLAAQSVVTIHAEALGQANLRAAPDVNSDQVGEILSGTRYPVVGRSEFYPWVLLGDPDSNQPLGWVFSELVAINGDINQVPFSSSIIDDAPPAAATPPPANATAVVNPPTATIAPTYQVYGDVLGEINIRYGPGVEYPRLGVATAGERLEIIGWHTQFPWVQIRYAGSPNGAGWVATDLLTISGNLFSLPSINLTRFNLPTLTPTPAVIQTGNLPGTEDVALSLEFTVLGNQLWNKVLTAGFDPETSKFGALFLMDLQTGEAITFGNKFAFSGTSINKVSILADAYRLLSGPPDANTAVDIANTMICSENVATNRMLSLVGQGDEYAGAEDVSQFLQDLGLTYTFLTAPYIIDPNNIPTPPRPIRYPDTGIDQTSANPDASNQLTVDEMGWLLANIYQCAYHDGGALMEMFPGQYSGRECRQMLHVMSNNTVDALLKAGVPAGTRVAHKHGWIADTHGNAAVFFTPGGDYVLVMMLYQPTWLDFQESLPLMAEVSRTVYNYYNPDAPMTAIREGYIPEAASCNFAGDPLIWDLMASQFDQ